MAENPNENHSETSIVQPLHFFSSAAPRKKEIMSEKIVLPGEGSFRGQQPIQTWHLQPQYLSLLWLSHLKREENRAEPAPVRALQATVLANSPTAHSMDMADNRALC